VTNGVNGIERVLCRHESVADAVVVDAGNRDQRLVAFVRLVDGATTTADVLLADLDERGADHGVPEALATVAALPAVTGPDGETARRSALVERAERILAAD